MRKIFIILSCMFLISCNNKDVTGKFSVTGEIKNAPDQKIYLEEIYFNQNKPAVIDTSELAGSKFTLKGFATEQGLYRLRLEKSFGYIFINDKDEIKFSANANDSSLQGPVFNTPANASLKKFIIAIDSLQSAVMIEKTKAEVLQQTNLKDSELLDEQNKFNEASFEYKTFLKNYIDTTSSPIIALFGLGYSQQFTEDELAKSVSGIKNRFPRHKAVAQMIEQYNAMISQKKEAPVAASLEGNTAPEITMPDTEGKSFSLSSLRGKYVLVDFWASWCGPCRQENPNVVAAYNEFKNRNFAILGVSLDQEKSAWLKAIKDDGLTWKHISDLKFWNSAAVSLYNIESIPFNVLIDPKGKIIASSLRGNELEHKLSEVLK